MKKLVALKMLNLCFAISFIGHYAILISRLVKGLCGPAS